ncbi:MULTISPECIES: ammonia-dependent NAD(+) synthetase [Paenibacillus]|jgi:NAD+ synthase|uniref:NH(3)-dependent NAD(+) synthetase n=1 Tax=Paenibacillus azoreducens TaxID=116718 RepID=A0A919Y630_9BACL|nr:MULTISPECIES: ammonia-dependent NAD(+) synthetase [Paenibacillus]MBE9914987.1 ammonia-dependent NAD(+) synthetase [Paenibacillus donghaensis]GIO45332.1 NH(3)-dependent NAD(+) synthetase [Paenibacillus azoreducens]
MSTQEQIMQDLNVKRTVDPKEEIRKRIDFLKAYCKKSGAKGYVLGISGGQDSTLAGRLSQLAAEELRAEGYDATFYAVRLPFGVQQDEDDAQEALAFIKPDQSLVFNIESSVKALANTYLDSTGETLSDYHKGNVKARMRMIAQYAIAGERQCLVVGTDHAAEAITGFFTKFGDGGADIIPLTGLTKGQGRELLKELNAAQRLYLKTPTADLLDNKPQQADETELGMNYNVIDEYLVGDQVNPEDQEKIEKRYKNTQHKRELPVTPFDEWWK